MASLRLFQACSKLVFVTSATRRRASLVAERCVQGIAGRRQKPRGKPKRQALWLRAIYAEVRAGRTSPDGVTPAVLDAWLPGDSLASTGVSDAEVGAAGGLAKSEAVAKKRKRTAIGPDVKDWLGQVCSNLASQVALTSCTCRKIFAAELKKRDIDWTPSRWPQLQKLGVDCVLWPVPLDSTRSDLALVFTSPILLFDSQGV